MQKIARVSSKGEVVIPAEMRHRLNISRIVIIKEEKGRIILERFTPMEESFGAGGKEIRQVTIGISKDRRKEVKSERNKLRV